MLRIMSVLAIVVMVAIAPAVYAQDVSADAPVTCDATLVTLLVTAMTNYGYQPPLRLDFYDFDQYTRLVSTAVGVELTDYPEDETAQDVGSQAASAVNEAAESLTAGGLPGLGDALADLSDEVSSVAEAGQQALETGQAAIGAGVAAIEGETNPQYLYYGGIPGENEACTILRVDLINFMYAQLGGQPLGE